MKKFLREFKEFAMRGNVMDLAVGVIVGGAFSSITNSLINDIIMPIVGIFVSQASFADLTLSVGGAELLVCYVLGLPLLSLLERMKIFPENMEKIRKTA